MNYTYLGTRKVGVPKLNAQAKHSFQPNAKGYNNTVFTSSGTSALATPGSGSPSGPQVAPLNDAGYNADVNSINREYADTSAGLNNKLYGVREQFGFDPEFSANPYTRANMLQRAADQRFRSTTNSMAARGQLYSGVTSRARLADDFTTGAETDSARRDYNAQLAAIEADRLANERTKSSGMDRAYLDMVERAAGADPDSSLFPQEPTGGAKSSGGAKQSQQKKQQQKASSYGAKRSLVSKPRDPGFYRNPVKKKGK